MFTRVKLTVIILLASFAVERFMTPFLFVLNAVILRSRMATRWERASTITWAGQQRKRVALRGE